MMWCGGGGGLCQISLSLSLPVSRCFGWVVGREGVRLQAAERVIGPAVWVVVKILVDNALRLDPSLPHLFLLDTTRVWSMQARAMQKHNFR